MTRADSPSPSTPVEEEFGDVLHDYDSALIGIHEAFAYEDDEETDAAQERYDIARSALISYVRELEANALTAREARSILSHAYLQVSEAVEAKLRRISTLPVSSNKEEI